MTFDIENYRKGYSLGVGGVVVNNNKVLLTCFAQGANEGEWAIPGGFVERDETIHAAVVREVLEETGVKAEAQGVLAVRSRTTPNENSTYIIFLLHSDSEIAQPDGVEIKEARYFTLEEVQQLERLRPLSKLVISRVLENKYKMLTQYTLPEYPSDDFVLFC